jgi:hypothetical protein
LDVLIEFGDAVPDSVVRSMYSWLVADEEIAGRVSITERSPAPGELGALAEFLQLSGPSAPVAVWAVAAWLRNQRSDITVKMRRPDKASVEISAKRVQGLSNAEFRSLVDSAATTLAGLDAPPDAPEEIPSPKHLK